MRIHLHLPEFGAEFADILWDVHNVGSVQPQNLQGRRAVQVGELGHLPGLGKNPGMKKRD